jgi:hypothetical protein
MRIASQYAGGIYRSKDNILLIAYPIPIHNIKKPRLSASRGKSYLNHSLRSFERYPASFDNYRLTWKNASFHLVIWHGHLWGEGFQMSVTGERQVTEGNGRGPSGQKVLISSEYGGFLAR